MRHCPFLHGAYTLTGVLDKHYITRLQSSIIERLLRFKGREVYSVGEIMDRHIKKVVFEVRLGV